MGHFSVEISRLPGSVLSGNQQLGTAVKGEITPEELQDLMAGGQELAQLEGSLGGTV